MKTGDSHRHYNSTVGDTLAVFPRASFTFGVPSSYRIPMSSAGIDSCSFAATAMAARQAKYYARMDSCDGENFIQSTRVVLGGRRPTSSEVANMK